ncbi:hypothetical protein N9381_05445 [Paracoccaceae bacterium]|nr:hypothetical protein [Paracoccaceae bacterium]
MQMDEIPTMDAKQSSASINSNKTIFQSKSQVMANTALICQSRSMIEEIRLMIISNYSAAFMGNRQLANTNTDEIFLKNIEILSNVKAPDGVQTDYLNAQIDSNNLEYLKQQSDLNTTNLKVNEKMATINAQLVAINHDIMKNNETIMAFNEKQIAVNAAMLKAPTTLVTATSEKNEVIIAENNMSIEQLLVSCSENEDMIQNLLEISSANREIVKKNKTEINERMVSIIKNRTDIFKNQI